MESRFTLEAYSAFATTLLLKASVSAEVVYTDIPDVILDESYDEYHMDIDDNGTEDYRFTKWSGSYVWSSSFGSIELRFGNILHIDLFNSTGVFEYNQVAGLSFSTYYSYYDYWPFALPFGAFINNDMDFKDGAVQIMASRIDLGNGIDWVPIKEYGYWWHITEDHYLGVHFVDNDNNYHYGWIRCSVLDSAEVLVIKDFAYETEIEQQIIAGDTVSYIGIEGFTDSIEATVYSFRTDINIHSESFRNTDVIIYDLKGKQLINKSLQNTNEVISMKNYPSGVYLVTLLNDGKRFDKRVFIE